MKVEEVAAVEAGTAVGVSRGATTSAGAAGSSIGRAMGSGAYLSEPENINELARKLTEFNMKYSERPGIRCGNTNSVLHAASYYETVLEQSAAAFQGIIRNHTFCQANKRTATEAFKKYCKIMVYRVV